MNEAVREAERRRPGTCHHEAAHAVFSYHANEPIAYVQVGKESESMARIRYVRGDPESTLRVVAGILAGRYAEELAATGKRREHVPYETLFEGVMEAWRTNAATAGIEMDEIQAFVILMSLGKQKAKEVYGDACVFAAEHVELWWDQIDALAGRLLEDGRVDGAEAVRVIESVAQIRDSRA